MKIFFTSLIFLIITKAYAVELDTNYLTLNFSGSGVELNHHETSSAPGFTALNDKSKIITYSLQAGLGKEFLADKLISFTVGGEYGILLGRDNKDLLAANLKYSDKVVGANYGLMGTINANFYYGKMRFHTFGGIHFLKSKTVYKLSYTPFNASSPKINIDYSEDATQSFLMAGVRFFDVRTQLFSVICAEYQVSSSFTKDVKASKINMGTFQLDQLADVKHVPARITVGFGYMF